MRSNHIVVLLNITKTRIEVQHRPAEKSVLLAQTEKSKADEKATFHQNRPPARQMPPACSFCRYPRGGERLQRPTCCDIWLSWVAYRGY